MDTIWRNIETGYGAFETKYRLWPTYDMVEIKAMLYWIIKDPAEQKVPINEQKARIIDQKASITHMLTEDD